MLGDYGLPALILDLMASMGNKGKGDGKVYWKLEEKKHSDLVTKCQNNLKKLEGMNRKPVSLNKREEKSIKIYIVQARRMP
jgi:hypothetical protein